MQSFPKGVRCGGGGGGGGNLSIAILPYIQYVCFIVTTTIAGADASRDAACYEFGSAWFPPALHTPLTTRLLRSVLFSAGKLHFVSEDLKRANQAQCQSNPPPP